MSLLERKIEYVNMAVRAVARSTVRASDLVIDDIRRAATEITHLAKAQFTAE